MRDGRDLYGRGAATLLASWEEYPRGSADAALTRLLKKSGRLDLNQRPFGSQPSGFRRLCVSERPSRRPA